MWSYCLDIPFLKKLSLDILKLECLSIEKACIASTKRIESTVLEPNYAGFVQRVISSLANDPYSVESTRIITSVWPVLAAQSVIVAENDITNRCLHRDIMLALQAAWSWLNVHCVTATTDFLDGHTVPDSWIVRLAKSLRVTVQNRIQTRDIHPSQFSDRLPGDVYRYSAPRINYMTPQQEDAATLRLTLEVVRHWLGFPPYLNNRLKALFVDEMVTHCGPAVLLLDSVWSAYNNVRRMVLVNSPPFSASAFTPSVFDVFTRELELHPLCIEGSPHQATLQLMARHVDLFTNDKDGIIRYIDPTTKHIIYPTVARNSGMLGTLLAYLLELIPLLPMTCRLPVSDMSPLQLAVHARPDHLLPFREHAPTRLRFSGDNSPFSPNVVRTREGLFSALIMRGITFNTEFSRSGPMMFNDVSEWNAVVEKHSDLPISYMVNASAYGSCNPHRHTKLAAGYWDATIFPQPWTEFVKEGPVSFLSCYKFFLASRPTKRFMEIGTLTAYLLTADYVYAGVVVDPSIEDLAELVSKINRGAVRGLEILGLIPERGTREDGTKKRAKVSDCLTGLIEAKAYCDHHFTLVQRKDTRFDNIQLEATLCKISRAHNLGLLADLLPTQ